MTDSGPASELQADEGVRDAPAEAARTPLWRRLAILGLKALPFARQMALPQLAALGVVTLALWVR